MEQSEANTQPAPGASPTSDEKADQPVDIKKLADKVYRLMLADLRLERKRNVRSNRRRMG